MKNDYAHVCKNCGTPYAGQKLKVYCSLKCKKEKWTKDATLRFWAKVKKDGGGCWLYTGFRKWDGYGWLSRYVNGKAKYTTAHRYAWILTHGEPAQGMHVLHRCDNPPCCNPAHLWLGTHRDNMADRVAKGRSKLGRIFTDRVRPQRSA